MMPNVPQYPVAIAAILRAGFVLVNVNPLYTPRELEHQLKDSGAKAIVVLENFATTLQQVAAKVPTKHVIVASMGDLLGLKGLVVNTVVRRVKKLVPAFSLPGSVSFKQALIEGRRMSLKATKVGPDDIAVLQYTGGTTGVSKGAMLLHRNLVANILQSEAWYGPAVAKVPKDQQFTVVCALPIYHVFGFTACIMLGMRMGSRNILVANPRDMGAVFKDLKGEVFHSFPAVNTLFNAMANHPEFGSVKWRNLVLSVGGGSAVQSGPRRCGWRKPAARSARATACPKPALGELQPGGLDGLHRHHRRAAAQHRAGLARRRRPRGAHGHARRDRDPRAAGDGRLLEARRRDGQGDDPGRIFPHRRHRRGRRARLLQDRDRKKDMILVSGFNVYPNEIEDVISKMPGVLECAAVGVPDAKTGEAVKLVIVRKDPALDEAAVRGYCEAQLTGYKKPKIVEFRTELPKSTVGKILRRELREAKK
jgi:long-chain acyl-CoA synthetase